jgi:hypothetical protein
VPNDQGSLDVGPVVFRLRGVPACRGGLAPAARPAGVRPPGAPAARARRLEGQQAGSPAPPASISVPGNANRTLLTRASLSLAVTAPGQDIRAGRRQVARRLHAGATRIARRAAMLAYGSLAQGVRAVYAATGGC